jgi:hypothetical protein
VVLFEEARFVLGLMMAMLVFDLSPDDNLLSFETFVLAVEDGEIVCMVGLFGVYI